MASSTLALGAGAALSGTVSPGSPSILSLLNHVKRQSCIAHALAWAAENSGHYSGLLCLKPIASKRRDATVASAHEKIASKISESCDEIMATQQSFLCVLPPGHTGKCTHTPHHQFITNKVIAVKLDWIYTTPGDDDYIYKNRCNRLFPITVPDEVEKQWRDKNVKLKCAIPLREASSPLLMASAYLDYITLILRVEGIDEHLKSDYAHLDSIRKATTTHADHLIAHYGKFKRRIFDSEGYSICPVTTDRITADHLGNNDIKSDTAVQLGHVVPRSETEFTIRGKNILLMSREGNRIVGDNVFTEDIWVNRLKRIIAGQSA